MSSNSIKNQLDFDAPFLSVRKTGCRPFCEIEDSNGADTSLTRVTSRPSYEWNLNYDVMNNQGQVPFQWEQMPGRPKNLSEPFSGPLESYVITPRLPPSRTFCKRQQNVRDRLMENAEVVNPQVCSTENITELQCTSVIENEIQPMTEDDDDCDTFTDARDTFSHSGSFIFNCSVSGLSVLDGSGSKCSEILSSDSPSRDFIMDRFLPACQATTSRTSRYASNKKPVINEPVRPIKTENGDGHPCLYPFKSHVLLQYPQYNGDETSDSEDEDLNDTRNISLKTCGFLPRFCFKGSFGLLNPFPGVKTKRRLPLSYVSANRMQIKTLHNKSIAKNETEKTWEAVYKYKFEQEDQLHFISVDGSKWTSDFNECTYWSDSQELEGSSSHWHSTGDGLSTHTSETHSPSSEGIGLQGPSRFGKNHKVNSLQVYNKIGYRNTEMSSNKDGKHGFSSIDQTIGIDRDFKSRMKLDVIPKEDIHQDAISLSSSLSPPLPKSPSESWLLRTLPSVSSKNVSSHLGIQFNSKRNAAKSLSREFDRKTFMQTSKVSQENVTFSEKSVVSS